MELYKIYDLDQLSFHLIKAGYKKVLRKRQELKPGEFNIYKYWKNYEDLSPRQFFELILHPITLDEDLGESLVLFADAGEDGSIFEWFTWECYAGSRIILGDLSGWDTETLEKNMLKHYSDIVELIDGK